MPKIKINDINLYYEIYGKGEPIVLIAGYSADHAVWTSILQDLSKDHQVLIFDNRGAGQSDCPDEPYTIDMFADDTVKLCQALNISKAHFVGSSMGGRILQTMAYRYSEIIKSAVISNSYTKIDPRFALQCKASLAFREAGNKLETIIINVLPWIFSSNFLSQSGMVDILISQMVANPYVISVQGLRSQLQALLGFDSSEWIEKINVPCLIIASDEDAIAPVKPLKSMAQSIPNAKYHCFEGVGHLPFIEKPSEFCRVLRDFWGMEEP